MAYPINYNPYGNNMYSQWNGNGQPNVNNSYSYAMPQPTMANAAAPSSDIVWVQGEVGARAYPVAPGRIAMLMDAEDSYFYIKAVDAYGMPAPLRKFRFAEILNDQKTLPQMSQAASPMAQMPQSHDQTEYVTKDELDRRISERLDELTK